MPDDRSGVATLQLLRWALGDNEHAAIRLYDALAAAVRHPLIWAAIANARQAVELEQRPVVTRRLRADELPPTLGDAVRHVRTCPAGAPDCSVCAELERANVARRRTSDEAAALLLAYVRKPLGGRDKGDELARRARMTPEVRR